jgi:hypothetical protein
MKQSAVNQNTGHRKTIIMKQSMALNVGSKLTVSLLLSDDGLAFWFKAG